MSDEPGTRVAWPLGCDERGDAPVAVTPDRLVQDWRTAHRRAAAYLAALGVAASDRLALATRAVGRALEATWPPGGDAVGETLRAARDLVQGNGTGGRDAFRVWRLRRLVGATVAGDDGLLAPTPALRRRSMVHEPIDRRLLHRLLPRRRRATDGVPAAQSLYGGRLRKLRRHLPWVRAAHLRRLLLVLLVLIPTVIASGFMVNVLPYQGRTWLEVAIAVVFGALFGWISIGFWTATLGFVVLARGRDRFAITSLAATATDAPDFVPPPDDIPTTGPRIAIVAPICAEPVARVFAGLRAIQRSLERAGVADQFHFYILSDTADPAVAVDEENAWLEWCRDTNGFGRIFYRRRKARIARKSGNVADFCRRFGGRYRYMIVLDADSLMAGATMARLVELMDRHPSVGMIQTVPTAVNRRSLLARVQQFSTRVYGPMFAAGLHWWQLGDGQYWGHNTIIRVKPFMEHCGLPRLPGSEPLGGEILSHDFVEAALMGRAGWGIWLAYDLPGSWEEVPSTLLEEMKRDRRWCQGNLQHMRLLFTEGLFGAHRMLFLNGALSYVSALLWFTFLVLSSVEAIANALREPDYFPHGPSLFPEWPIFRPDWAISLMGVTAVILFLPKLLAILLLVFRSVSVRAHGGVVRLLVSVVLEVALSSLLAPIRMVFHSRFVVMNLLGRTVSWGAQGREDQETSWREGVRQHAVDSLFASAWGVALYALNPGYFWWITPIIGALLLSIPVSVLSSRVSWGRWARRLGLFLIPEEGSAPPELRDLRLFQDAAIDTASRLPPAERDGFVRAVVDPWTNVLHRALLGRPRALRAEIRAARRALVERALRDGPASLGTNDRRVLLLDPELVDELHEHVWALPDPERAARWGRPGLPPDPETPAR